MTRKPVRGSRNVTHAALLFAVIQGAAFILASCKHSRGDSGIMDTANLTEPQRLMLNDLENLKKAPATPIEMPTKPQGPESGATTLGTSTPQPPSSSSALPVDALALAGEPDLAGFKHVPNIDSEEPVSSVVRRLTPEADGTFSFVIDDLKIKIDPKPTTADRQFTDFFTALNNGVGDLVRSSKEQGNLGENARQILEAYKAKDLDLIGSKIAREESDTGSGFANPQIKSVFVNRPYTQIRQIYILSGLARLAEATRTAEGQRPSFKASPKSTISPQCERKRTLISPSLVPFKRGDLDQTCSAAIDAAIEQGFLRMTLFFPVHIAADFRPSSTGKLSSHPQSGRDYRIERLLAPTSGELRRCVTNILGAGLELTYIPHIESITTMVAKGENEWRIAALIPLDDPQLYDTAYAPLVEGLRANPNKIRNRVSISLGAEIDRSVLYLAESTLNLANKLKVDLKGIPASKIQLSYNPNGDFYTISPQEIQRVIKNRGTTNVACSNLSKLLGSHISSIGPSIYDRYNHVYPIREMESQRPPEFASTRDEFMIKFFNVLLHFCNDRSEAARMFSSLKEKFDIGEFSLQTFPNDIRGTRMGMYDYFLQSALQQSKSPYGRINLWSSGEFDFDPLANPSSQSGGDKFKTADQILNFLKCQ